MNRKLLIFMYLLNKMWHRFPRNFKLLVDYNHGESRLTIFSDFAL